MWCADFVILPASPFEQDGSDAAAPLVDAAPSDPQAAEEMSIPASASEVEVQAAHFESEATDLEAKNVETGTGPEVDLSETKAEVRAETYFSLCILRISLSFPFICLVGPCG